MTDISKYNTRGCKLQGGTGYCVISRRSWYWRPI